MVTGDQSPRNPPAAPQGLLSCGHFLPASHKRLGAGGKRSLWQNEAFIFWIGDGGLKTYRACWSDCQATPGHCKWAKQSNREKTVFIEPISGGINSDSDVSALAFEAAIKPGETACGPVDSFMGNDIIKATV